MADCLQGTVIRRRYAPGSKSDRQAVMLRLTDGRDILLRRRDGNPFVDPVLETLVGQHLRLWGEQVEDLFILDRWETLSQTGD